MYKHYQLAVVVALLAAARLFAAPAADYEAARSFRKKTAGTVENQTVRPVWKPDGSALFYRYGGKILEIDTATGTKREAVDTTKLSRFFDGDVPDVPGFTVTEDGGFICLAAAGGRAKTLKASEDGFSTVADSGNPFALRPRKITAKTRSGRGQGASRIYFVNNTEKPLDIVWITSSKKRKKYTTLKPGGTHVQKTYAGHVFAVGGLAFTATRNPGIAFAGAEPEPPKANKKKKSEGDKPRAWKAEIRNHNLFAKNADTGDEIQLTTDGTADHYYHKPFGWSPDGRHLVVAKTKAGTRRKIDLIHAAPADRLQPRTETISYAKPGDDIDLTKPHLFNLEAGKEIPLDDTLFANPFFMRTVRDSLHWSAESGRFFFLYNERGHQTMRLLAVEAATGEVRPVVEEKSETFIDHADKTFVHHLDGTDEAIWMSERSGWNHLYLVDRRTGETKPITSGEWVVRGVEHIDGENRRIWFKLAGYHPGQDPYYLHYARINFDGTGLVLLTEGNGTHSVDFSEDRRFYVDTWSRIDHAPVHELRRSSDGRKVADLGQADASKWRQLYSRPPEPFVAKGRNGKTDIHGAIFFPSDFDPAKKYPVVEAIYASPHDFFTPKAFKTFHTWQTLPELGFIVVKLDGMGTNWRSKAFHDVCWKNLKDSGFPDRIAWIKAAAKKYPSMDLSRVGIYGSSAGGQSAMRALLDHSGFYKAAVADCGCHDNRMDKIWWNEAWMGWPVDESYVESSNVADAHKLRGKLLLAVGMLDSNVDPSSTMQVVDALIKANKEFEFHADPSGGHCVLGSAYGQHLRRKFFVRHLLNPENP